MSALACRYWSIRVRVSRMIGMTQTLYLAMPMLGLHKALILSLMPSRGLVLAAGPM